MSLILDLLFPKKCVGCGRVGSYSEHQRGASSAYFCHSCVSNIKQKDLVCPRCDRVAVGGQTHPICRRKFGLDGLWSLGIYQGSLREAIKQLKYGRVKEMAAVLGNITSEYWAKYQPFVLDQIKKDRGEGWVVIPVPLYWWRTNSRGFNQSSLFGQSLSKSLGLAYCDGLKRTRYTRSQVGLKEKDRRKNIFNAFEIAADYTLSPKPYILLIDDVWTTGSTLRECCYVLKRAGAKKVWAITLAR